MGIDPKLCVLCRGRFLCGLAYCPVIARSKALLKLKGISSERSIEGSSPPAVFVGRIGYPYVRVGPSLPPVRGDTSIYDFPEQWLGIRLEDILEYRLSLVSGLREVDVKKPSDRLVEELRLVAMSAKPVDLLVEMNKPPRPFVSLSEEVPPMGPRGELVQVKVIDNPSVPRAVEKAYSDTDLKASGAVLALYSNGIPISYIQKMFSMGAFGVKEQRRLVPTRWSITAVDSIIARSLLRDVKAFDSISEIEVYALSIHDNLFIAILHPGKWSFEWMEAWWPGSTWNPMGLEPQVEGDHEGYSGRTTYPGLGGCYYASLLATAEYLHRRRRQGTAILLREIYPGFNLPIG
ncbi:MAG: Nre family DNA repair protein, partial [Acidilobaceae archaeon]